MDLVHRELGRRIQMNTTAARTLDGIYLRYTKSHQGGHEILHLPTNKVIVRRNITELPITNEIVEQVNCLAREEKMIKGLKILTHDNTALYDSTLLAGVDDEDSTEDSSNQEIIQENKEYDQTDEEETSEHDQDEMDPDDIAALTKVEVIQEDNDDHSNSEQESESNNQKSAETNVDKETEEDLPQEQCLDNDQQTRTRSGRVSRPVFKYVTHHNHLQTQSIDPTHYTTEYARLIATTMTSMNYTFAQTYSLAKGIKVFGDKGSKAAYDEMRQLHD